MAFSFSDQGNGTEFTTGSVAAAAVAVSTGDLIVVGVGSQDSNVWCTGVTDTAGNSYTVRAAVTRITTAYCIGATAHATNIITATFNNATNARKNIIVSVYTPDGGETVTLDVAMTGTSGWEASPWETGTDNTTGTDEVCVAAVQSGGTVTFSNHDIPGGTAATALTDPGNSNDGWYRILSATAAGLYAEVDPSATSNYSMEMLCFKSVAAAGGNAPTGALYGPLVGPMGGPI